MRIKPVCFEIGRYVRVETPTVLLGAGKWLSVP